MSISGHCTAWDISGKMGERDKMNWIVLGSAVLLFVASIAILLYVRKGLVQYTAQLIDSLDAVLAGEKEIDIWEGQETLNGKLREKLCQLGEVLEQRSGENLRQRKQLEAIGFAEPVFREKFPNMQQPIHCLFNAAEGTFDQLNEEVSAIAQYGGLTVQTRLTAEEEFREYQYMYNMIDLVCSLILGGIGILNLINMILTSVIARQKEFASMRSIGMTQRQLRRLVVYEGICYAVLAGVVGIALSAVLSLTLVQVMAEGMWFMKYSFTIAPAVLTSVVCLLLSVCISAMTDRTWNKGSIVEMLREAG